MDLEAQSTIKVDPEITKDIEGEVNKLIETQKERAITEEKLKTLKETERGLSEQSIPNLMQEAGYSEIKLVDGLRLKLKKRKPSTGFVTTDLGI